MQKDAAQDGDTDRRMLHMLTPCLIVRGADQTIEFLMEALRSCALFAATGPAIA